ncbi:MAG: MotA/TolQ/ExbB proton channel family protein [Methylomonas sp.]|jgi:biopolymer transport protein ExbB|uniref:MotA/TolQ/ExbB proton channel family protein n=1 Tax=Methylomonas sp. TaxID=418 RepID=UPI0025E147ED|nr:MotA/TolQ/ExbB proton channel family protein [Methylomonas sp.]MCK9606185.1 MotA/TolQ/ExbB proton channel family protein [Methylomonas sp.]
MSFNQNLSHFLSQSDGVGQSLFLLLIVMSVGSWYFILVKAWHAAVSRRRTRQFLSLFWNAASLDEVAENLNGHRDEEPFSHLTYHAINATRHHAIHGSQRLQEAGSAGEFLTRAIRRVIDEETAKLEWGLTILASIASTAPFIGLFGTVWGVYHALLGIGQNGQGTLEQIAGPVGEALIMTGLGLAVAIPAVLAYNDCVRSNRLLLAQLDAFAHDLFAFLTTGSTINAMPENSGSLHQSALSVVGEN